MNDVLMQRFIQLVSTNIGLHVREQDREILFKKIYARMKLLNLSVPEQYYQLLKTENNNNSSQDTLSQREWKELTLILTTGETFFFRDQGQITLLKNRILPEVIEYKKQACYEGKAKPSLRIWSAGCSTGEEPYSLAIIVKELIPDWDKWNILILGTDINPESIEKAKRGIYNSWSFRMVKSELQQQYFYQRNTGWEVNEQIRRMVTFQSGNLLKDHFPCHTSSIHSMDIILCRNVFIYFESQTISIVLEKFYNTLRPEGYLIAGHTELHGQNLGQLQAKVFPESVVYQRQEEKQVATRLVAQLPISHRLSPLKTLHEQTATSPAQTIHSTSASTFPLPKQNRIETTSQAVLRQAETLFQNGAYASAVKEAEQVIKQYPNHFGAYYLMAQAFANLGECEQAVHCCQQALDVDSLSVNPYYLLAHIAEEQGKIEKAKELFKKIIYLAPSSISAFLELGSLYESEGDRTRARKMRNTAFELLKELPPHVNVHQSETTAGELMFHVKKLLKNHT